jgi:hypothetical protein
MTPHSCSTGCCDHSNPRPHEVLSASHPLSMWPLQQALQDMGPPGGVVPTPVQAFVTRWAADPFARGSYSFYAVGNPRNIVGELWLRHDQLHHKGGHSCEA